ncbi:MAG: alpha/beta hydrolase [Blastocatellia bacterium]|nr:alpha/beta hydrolase [Blastocatellia bacterium]
MLPHCKHLGDSHAETILFIPGLTGSHSCWDVHFQALRRNYNLILVDTLGFGRSPKPEIDHSLDDHLNALAATLESCHVRQTNLVGHSMGSLLGLAFAQRFPDRIGKLCFLALPWFTNEQAARESIRHSSFFNRWLSMDTPLAHAACMFMYAVRPLLLPIIPHLVRDVPPMVAQDALRHTWTSYSQTLQNVIFQAETSQWMAEITHPPLLIHGRQDTTAPLANVKKNLSLTRHAELIELEADHGLIFTHSQTIATRIAEFFAVQ